MISKMIGKIKEAVGQIRIQDRSISFAFWCLGGILSALGLLGWLIDTISCFEHKPPNFTSVMMLKRIDSDVARDIVKELESFNPQSERRYRAITWAALLVILALLQKLW